MITKTCIVSGKKFEITESDLDFYKKMEIISAEDYEKLKSREISDCSGLPKMTPDELMRRLMTYRNEFKLFNRKCDKTDKNIISAYHEKTIPPVWKNEAWWADNWNATEYGKEFDFSRDFFLQFEELQNVVPREGTSVSNSENCSYNAHTMQSKNCYLNYLLFRDEDVYYSYWIVNSQNLIDCTMMSNSQLCYRCLDVTNGYECMFSQELQDCQNCYFSFQLRSCSNCIGCSNLYQKKYHIFNKPVSKEEFEKTKKEMLDGGQKTLKKGAEFLKKIKSQTIHRESHNMKSENVTGDHVNSSKNCINCFDGYNCEDCKYAISISNAKDIHTCYSAGFPSCELVYNSSATRESHNILFSYYSFSSSDLVYCDSCRSCKNCFGCVGLRSKEYCILNKQYSREEYFKIRGKIITHMKETDEWGEFFPTSPFAYNESVAQEFFPLTKKDALSAGYKWRDEDEKKHQPQIYKIPDKIKDVPDSICNEILACEKTGKNYQIQKSELIFYRQMNLPIPFLHPDERQKDRLELRNPRTLFERACDSCQKQIQTTFSPDRPEKVYCEKCYLNKVK